MITEINRSALLLYPAQSMFALVNDIESYPKFMHGCVGAEVLSSSEDLSLIHISEPTRPY